MDVREVQAKRDALCRTIQSMLQQFHNETGAAPELTVYWDTLHQLGGPPKKIPIVSARLEL